MKVINKIELNAKEVEDILGFKMEFDFGTLLGELGKELSEEEEDELSLLVANRLKSDYDLYDSNFNRYNFTPSNGGVSFQFRSKVGVGWEATEVYTVEYTR